MIAVDINDVVELLMTELDCELDILPGDDVLLVNELFES